MAGRSSAAGEVHAVYGGRGGSGGEGERALLEFAQSLMALEGEGTADARWQGA